MLHFYAYLSQWDYFWDTHVQNWINYKPALKGIFMIKIKDMSEGMFYV